MKENSSETRRMIAIVAPALAREGITKQIANQIIGLLQHKEKVCLIVLGKSDSTVLEEYGVALNSIPVLPLMQPDSYLSFKAFIGAPFLIRSVLKFLKQQEVGVVIAHGSYTHFVMRLAKMAAPLSRIRFKLIQYFHGLQYSEYPVTTWKRRGVNSLNQWLAKKCDDVHVSVSQAVKQEIETYLIRHAKHEVIYNAIQYVSGWNKTAEDTWEQLRPALEKLEGKFAILLPNRIDHNKGQLFFLDVLEQFLKEHSSESGNICVLLAGEGPQRKDAEQFVLSRGMADVVLFTGALPNAVIQKVMLQVHLVVIPSLQEGFSFATLEALAAGCLVLASDTGGLKEIIGDGENGILFKAGDASDCLVKLKMIYAKFGQGLIDKDRVRDYARTSFSPELNTQKLLQVIYSS